MEIPALNDVSKSSLIRAVGVRKVQALIEARLCRAKLLQFVPPTRYQRSPSVELARRRV